MVFSMYYPMMLALRSRINLRHGFQRPLDVSFCPFKGVCRLEYIKKKQVTFWHGQLWPGCSLEGGWTGCAFSWLPHATGIWRPMAAVGVCTETANRHLATDQGHSGGSLQKSFPPLDNYFVGNETSGVPWPHFDTCHPSFPSLESCSNVIKVPAKCQPKPRFLEVITYEKCIGFNMFGLGNQFLSTITNCP